MLLEECHQAAESCSLTWAGLLQHTSSTPGPGRAAFACRALRLRDQPFLRHTCDDTACTAIDCTLCSCCGHLSRWCWVFVNCAAPASIYSCVIAVLQLCYSLYSSSSHGESLKQPGMSLLPGVIKHSRWSMAGCWLLERGMHTCLLAAVAMQLPAAEPVVSGLTATACMIDRHQ